MKNHSEIIAQGILKSFLGVIYSFNNVIKKKI